MEKIEQAAADLERIRTGLLFDGDFDDGVLDAVAQCEFLQALALIDAAQRGLGKVAILQARALAASPYRQ